MRIASVIVLLVASGCPASRAERLPEPSAPTVSAAAPVHATHEEAPRARVGAAGPDAPEATPPSDEAPELRACVRTRADGGGPAALTLPGVGYVDARGRLVRFDFFERGADTPRFSYAYRWEDDRMVAEKVASEHWSIARWDESGSWVEEVSSESGVSLRSRTAEGRWGIGGAPVVHVPPHGSLQAFAMPFALDFAGLVRERGTLFDTDHVYEAGRLVRIETRKRTGGEIIETTRFTWDDRDRLLRVDTDRSARDVPDTHLRVVWDGDRPVRIESLKKGRVHARRELTLDHLGRLVGLHMNPGDMTFAYDYTCDDVRPHHLLGGVPLI
jgi:hypothetical protein